MGHALGNNYGKFYSFLSKPVLVDLQFTVTPTNGLGITALKGQGVENVFMYTSTTPTVGPNGYLNPNPAAGYALIQLSYNYNRFYGGFSGAVSPVTGGELAIDASALTPGLPYVITTVGHATAGAATIDPVADSSGNLAGTYFSLFDAYGNTFIIWFTVDSVGIRPNLGPEADYGTQGLHYVQQDIPVNESAANIGTALAVTIAAQPSGISGLFSFTAAGTTTVTVTSTGTGLQFAGIPMDGVSPLDTGFTFALTKYTTNLSDWQAVGLPKGVVPAVGVSFIATATGYSTGGASTGKVKAVGTSAITDIEVIGDTNLSLNPIPMGGSPNAGGWVLVQFMAPLFTYNAGTPSSSTNVMTPTAPTTGSIVRMTFYVEQGTRVGGNSE